ncbi:MAG TPA: hypothetical protein VMI10_19950 [Terriglobales bacterium]|nr:hypothetical protein [Terriglobales bacterium]
MNNFTVIVALAVAWVVVMIGKRFLKYVLVHKVGKAALDEVGKRALARVPQTAGLTKTEFPAWTHAADVDRQAAPLRNEGFQDLGAYTVNTIPGVVIRMMAQPETYVAAHVYDHPKAGSWVEFVTRYTDGSSHSLTNPPPTGMDQPAWFRKIQADKNTPTDQLYRQFLTQRQQTGIKQVAPEDSIREFVDNYAKLMVWRQERGLTTKEVAHVTLDWLEKKKAAGTTS